MLVTIRTESMTSPSLALVAMIRYAVFSADSELLIDGEMRPSAQR